MIGSPHSAELPFSSHANGRCPAGETGQPSSPTWGRHGPLHPQHPEGMTQLRMGNPRRRRLWVLGATAWTLLYVASKVHYALEGRLGVTGGPRVAASSYANYGPGEVAAAQWGNAAVGCAVVLIFALCALPLTRRLPRILLSVLVGLVALVATAGAVGMLGRAALTDSGGAVFGGYCLVWAVLSTGVLVTLIRAPGARREAPVGGRTSVTA